MDQNNSEKTGAITALSPDGKGILKTEEDVIFVEGGFPGQKVEYKITGKKRGVFFAETIRVLEESEHVRKPIDPEYPQFGGALWQVLQYQEQIQWKQQFVKDAMERIGKIEAPVENIVPSVEEFRYRNKMEFSFGYESVKCKIQNVELKRKNKESVDNHQKNRKGGIKKFYDENPGLGMHKKGNWKEIIRITDTCIATEKTMQIRKIIENFALKSNFQVWNSLPKKGFWRNVVVRHSKRTGEILVNIFVVRSQSEEFWKPLLEELTQNIPEIVSLQETVHDGVSVASFDAPKKILFGKDHFFEELKDIQFKISADAFFQVNTLAAEKLIDTIVEYGELNGHEKVLDLFCGAGTLGLSVAKNAKKIVGIEIISSAVENAKENAKQNGIENAEFYCGPVEEILPEILGVNFEEDIEKESSSEKEKFDVVIVDPPRAGLPKKVRKLLHQIPTKKIVMVSCNPATLARDLASLEEYGLKTIKIRPHDLFPQTPHVETVAVLENV